MPPAAPSHADLEAHRPYLVRYARLQLRNGDAAEDVVQETLLAALENKAGFAGRSQLRTWLTGILKHKIIDHLRRQAREAPLALDEDGDPEAAIDALFKEDGHWKEMPADWGRPDEAFENKAFWEVLERCQQQLPPKAARVFMLREMMELPTEDICKELAITSTNCWVMLHRARLSLRQCLEALWFGNRAERE
jgi:RNA polymerase sigma-70 factor (ECF subfamily)